MARHKVRHIELRPDEFIAGTFGQLTIEEFAVFWAVCLTIYSKSGPVDDDTDRFCAAFRWRRKNSSQSRVVRRALDDLIAMGKLRHDVDGKLVNGRSMAELERAVRRVITARENGSQGGRPPAHSTPARRPLEARPKPPKMKKINDLTKPDGYKLLNPYESSSSDTITDAARDPARDAGAPGRAPAEPGLTPAPASSDQGAKINARTNDSLTELAAKARARFLKGQS